MIIAYPKKESEFEVQAKLHAMLRDDGLDSRGEVICRCDENGQRGYVRFDIVVFENEVAVAIIECKNSPWQKPCMGERQTRRYSLYGIPVFLCSNSSEINDTIQGGWRSVHHHRSLVRACQGQP